MQLARLGLWAALLPAVTVHLTWVTAASTGALQWCNPYWSHCHSISATGREIPQFYLFKALMLPSAIIMIAYWRQLRREFSDKLAESSSLFRLIEILGIGASVSLIVYTLTLGAIGELFVLPRRIGVVGYFAFTAFAHLLLLAKLKVIIQSRAALYVPYQALFCVCALLLVLGVISAFLGFFWPSYHFWDNAFEWWFALLMICQFLGVARVAQIMNVKGTKNVQV